MSDFNAVSSPSALRSRFRLGDDSTPQAPQLDLIGPTFRGSGEGKRMAAKERELEERKGDYPLSFRKS